RVIYAVNTDWWSTPARTAQTELHLAGKTYTLPVERDRIIQITIRGEAAAVTSGMETEVLDIVRDENGYLVRVQGDAGDTVTVYGPNIVSAQAGSGCTVRLATDGVQNIRI